MGIQAFFPYLLIHCLWLLPFSSEARPFPEKGTDTVHYWISRMELVDGVGVRSSSHEITLIHGANRARFTAYLAIQKADSLKGPHWDPFFKKLRSVPFFFLYKDGKLNNLDLNQTYAALDRLMLTLLDDPVTADPDAFSAIGKWMNGLKPRSELPLSLQNAFSPLLSVFESPKPDDQEVITLIPGCNEDTLQLRTKIITRDSTISKDSLQLKRIRQVDGMNKHSTYQQLANCLKLEGLDVVITVDGYSNHSEETWLHQKTTGPLLSYSYVHQILLRFGDYITLREFRTYVVRM